MSEILGLPMCYVRGAAKDHGRGNRIEGRAEPGAKVVVIEDLISTGGSVLEVVDALRQAGCEVLGIASIFTYGLEKGVKRLADAGVQNASLSCYDALLAARCGGGRDRAGGCAPARTVPPESAGRGLDDPVTQNPH